MPYYIGLAFKNIFRDPRRSFTLGVNYFFVAMLLALVFSLSGGLKKNIVDTIISSTAGHITISGETITKGKTLPGIRLYHDIKQAIIESYPGAAVYPRYTINSAVYYKNQTKRLSFTGIQSNQDVLLRNQITITDGSWESFSESASAVIFPKAVADFFGLQKGDEILLANRSRAGAFNTATVTVAGIYTTGNYFLRQQVLSHFEFLQSLDLADSTSTTRLFVFFPKLVDIAAKRDILVKKLVADGFYAQKPATTTDAINAVAAASPRYKILPDSISQIRLTLSTADEVTGIVSAAVGAVNGLGLFVAAIMLFIISISIFINMRMTINDRMQEIGTLRAIGSEQGDIVALFVFENVFLSLLFVTLGILGAFGIMGIIGTFLVLPSDGFLGLFLSNGHIVFVVQPLAILFIFVTLLLFTALFSLFPARYGGKIPPVVALNKTA